MAVAVDMAAQTRPAILIRRAVPDEVPALEALVARSARALGQGFYSDAELDAAIAHVFGVDSGLVADGTYLVAERDGALAGCGGWSRRRTLFGGDRFAARDDAVLDPAIDAARIRAFFVDPDHARVGIGRAILDRCEAEARAAGFRAAELMATLSGEPFYRAAGYRPGAAITYQAGATAVPFVPMRKVLSGDRARGVGKT
jgi:GNAT superfamily N-acetyltransferase